MDGTGCTRGSNQGSVLCGSSPTAVCRGEPAALLLGRCGAVTQTLLEVSRVWRWAPLGRSGVFLLPQSPWQYVVPSQHHWQYPRHPHAIETQLPLLLFFSLNGEESDAFGSLQPGQMVGGLRAGFVRSVEPQVTAVVGLQAVAQPGDEVRGVVLKAPLLPRCWCSAVREHCDGCPAASQKDEEAEEEKDDSRQLPPLFPWVSTYLGH